MPLNVELLLKVKQHILAEPARLRMDTWLLKKEPGFVVHTSLPGYEEPEDFTIPACGTVGCIAGWVAFLNNPDVDQNSYEVRGDYVSELLGINDDYAPFPLFWPDHWPIRQREAYYAASNNETRAQITALIIDKFISEYRDYENAVVS